jgi:hypothetical protein
MDVNVEDAAEKDSAFDGDDGADDDGDVGDDESAVVRHHLEEDSARALDQLQVFLYQTHRQA